MKNGGLMGFNYEKWWFNGIEPTNIWWFLDGIYPLVMTVT